MDARKLLENIEARGGVASVKRDGGAAVLNVSPRSLALELLPDLRRNKSELLALLARDDVAPVHRWRDESPDVPADVPDLRALSVAVEGARRGAHLCPTPELLAIWRALSAFARAPLTSRHVGAAARLVAQHPTLTNNELLDLFGAGLMPDEGDGAPVWIEPQTLFDAMHATAKARANQNEVTK